MCWEPQTQQETKQTLSLHGTHIPDEDCPCMLRLQPFRLHMAHSTRGSSMGGLLSLTHVTQL